MGIFSRAASLFAPAPKALPPAAPPPAKTSAEIVAQMSPAEWSRTVALIRAGVMRQLRRQNSRESDSANGIASRQIGVFLRWGPLDRERILSACESGDFYALGLFIDALRSIGVIYGIMRQRTALLRLPQQWTGDPLLIDYLKGKNPEFDEETGALLDPGHRSDFQQLFPIAELGAVLHDGDFAGLGIGEFVPDPVTGRKRLRHLDLHWVRYDWGTRELVYDSPWDRYVIKPGDGRWFVYAPYGLERWWTRAPWLACALPAISILDSMLGRLRWACDLADPLKLILADEDREDGDFDDLDAFAAEDWNRASHLVLRKGESAELVESTGRGYEVYTEGEKAAADAIKLALAGQLASTGDGGGLSKDQLQGNIDAAITGLSAEQLAETVHTQGLAWYAKARGRAPLVWITWDCRTSEQKAAEAKLLADAADGIAKINAALAPVNKRLDLEAYQDQIGIMIPTEDLPETAAPAGTLDSAPTSLDAALDVNEVRQNKGFPAWPAPKGQKTIAELKDTLGDTNAVPGKPAATASAYAGAEILVFESREVAGLPIVIDRPRGSMQRGVGPDGPWERTFKVDYGYVEGTTAPDGEGVDVYLGPLSSAPYAFAIMQVRRDGEADEWKIMLGFQNVLRAIQMYREHVPAWGLGAVVIVPTSEIAHWIALYAEMHDPNTGDPPPDPSGMQVRASASLRKAFAGRRVYSALASAAEGRRDAIPLASVPALADHPALTAPFVERYPDPDEMGGWVGVLEDPEKTWVAFVDTAGHALLWTKRDPDGGVVGTPFAFDRPDLASEDHSVSVEA